MEFTSTQKRFSGPRERHLDVREHPDGTIVIREGVDTTFEGIEALCDTFRRAGYNSIVVERLPRLINGKRPGRMEEVADVASTATTLAIAGGLNTAVRALGFLDKVLGSGR